MKTKINQVKQIIVSDYDFMESKTNPHIISVTQWDNKEGYDVLLEHLNKSISLSDMDLEAINSAVTVIKIDEDR